MDNAMAWKAPNLKDSALESPIKVRQLMGKANYG
jgi:hypothetical protein